MHVTANPVINEISGKLGSMVFYSRNGKTFVRRWVIPKDPKTPLQKAARKNFANLVKTWQRMNAEMKQSWKHYPGRRGTPYNAFMSENMKRSNRGDQILLYFMPSDIQSKKIKYLYSVPCVLFLQPVFSLVITSLWHEYSMFGSSINLQEGFT